MPVKRKNGFAHLFLVFILGLIGLVWLSFHYGLISINKKPLTSLKNISKKVDTALVNGKTRILGIYEMEDSVFFTTNNDVTGKMFHWLMPESKTQMFLGSGVAFSSKTNSRTRKGFGYQLTASDSKGNEVSSDEYLFQGKRVVLEDPRCPEIPIDKIEKYVARLCKETMSCLVSSENETGGCPFDLAKVYVYKLPMDYEWKSNGSSFKMTYIYLLPEIKDLPKSFSTPEKWFLIAEVNETALEESEDAEFSYLPLQSFFMLKDDNKNKKPVSLSDETFVVFAVDKNQMIFKLLVGPNGNQDEIDLNFSSDKASKVEGEFLLKDGGLQN